MRKWGILDEVDCVSQAHSLLNYPEYLDLFT